MNTDKRRRQPVSDGRPLRAVFARATVLLLMMAAVPLAFAQDDEPAAAAGNGPAAAEAASPAEEEMADGALPAAEDEEPPEDMESAEGPGEEEAAPPAEDLAVAGTAAVPETPSAGRATTPAVPSAPGRPFGSVGQTGAGAPVGAVAPFAGEEAGGEALVPGRGAILLNFQDAPITAVLDHLSEVAGLVIVYDASVQGRVSILARRPVSVDEAVSLLNTVLKEQGFAAIRMGRTLKVITLTEAKERSIPVYHGSDPEEIEPTDEMRTQVVSIRYADAVRLREDLSALIPSYAAMTANASSNSLILTDTAANVRRIVEIVRALDTQLSQVAEIKVFALKYADATAAARLINDVFQQDSQSTQNRNNQNRASTRFRGGPQFGRGGPDQQQQQQQGEGEGARNQRVFAAADERTNTVVVSGPGDVLVVVEQVIKELDANPVAEQSVLVYAVKNADAENLATVLNNLFGSTSTTGTRGTTGRGTTGRGTQGSVTSGRGSFMQRFAQASQSTVQAASGLAGQVDVVADADSQSLLIMTAPANFDQVRAILADLDRAVPQVLIKVLIAEVSHDRKVDLGSEFSVLNLPEVVAKSALFTDFGVADATEGGIIARLIGGDASGLLRALETIGKLDILSRPYILASDNQEATITVGQEFPFVRESRTTETGQTINTIEYDDIGIILTVTPHINPQGLVILDVSPEISAVTDSTVPISETLDATILNKRSATTRVAIHDGQTIVIGGLMEDRKTDTIKKVPLLGDIPLLGFFFRRTVQNKVKTELLIFLTPHVASEAGMLKAMSDDEMLGVQAVPNAVGPGVFDDHLRGLSRGAAKPEPSGEGE